MVEVILFMGFGPLRIGGNWPRLTSARAMFVADLKKYGSIAGQTYTAEGITGSTQ